MGGEVIDGRFRAVRSLGERSSLVEPLGGGGLRVLSRRFGVPATFERVRREADALRRLAHPDVVSPDVVGELPRTERAQLVSFYVCRALVPGTSLDPVAGESLELFARLCDALAAAHAIGVRHRRVCPENVIVDDDKNPRLVDIGVWPAPGEHPPVTADFGPVAPPLYLAPEMAGGGAWDQRADLYAVGVLLYQSVCGAPPFVGRSPIDVVVQAVRDEPPPPARVAAENGRRCPAELERLVLRAMAKDPRARFESAEELALALRTMR